MSNSSAVNETGNYFGANTCGATTAIFNRCIQDLLFVPSGMVYASVEDFCKPVSLQGDLARYNCLCSKFKVVMLCYETNCPNDASYSTAYKTEANYCEAASQYAPTVSPTLWSNAQVGPTLSLPTGEWKDEVYGKPVKGAAAEVGFGVVVGLIAAAAAI
ncbi:hypothetical protein BJ741DRAFT_269832 [Chytriomyces cf. hyalinus JEL632]|nr:hypothetical protein BJ741DRAFT_269832 [Chytriomyces cf. hyalinus JEL632]